MDDEEHTESIAVALAKEAVKVAEDLAASTSSTNVKMSDAIHETSQLVALLGERLGFVQTTLDEVKLLLARNYVTCESFKPVVESSKDHESRLRKHDKVIYGGLGALAVAELVFKFFLK